MGFLRYSRPQFWCPLHMNFSRRTVPQNQIFIGLHLLSTHNLTMLYPESLYFIPNIKWEDTTRRYTITMLVTLDAIWREISHHEHEQTLLDGRLSRHSWGFQFELLDWPCSNRIHSGTYEEPHRRNSPQYSAYNVSCVGIECHSKSDDVGLVRFTNTEWLKHEAFGSGFAEEPCCQLGMRPRPILQSRVRIFYPFLSKLLCEVPAFGLCCQGLMRSPSGFPFCM